MELSENQKIKGTLFFLYLGKLIEFGLIHGSYKLTPKGFDIAQDAYDSGLRLTDQEIVFLIKQTPGMEDPEASRGIFEFIHRLQEIGIDEMKKEVEFVKERMDKVLEKDEENERKN